MFLKFIIFITIFCFSSSNPVLNPPKTDISSTPLLASKLTSYPNIASDIQASDLFDLHFPVYLTIENRKIEFSRTDWTETIIFDKIAAAALNKKVLDKFCVNFPEDGTVEFTKDEQSISVLLLRAMKEDNHLVVYQC